MTNSFSQKDLFPKEIEQRMINHMNTDHVDAMRDYCRYANFKTGEIDPQMTHIDQNGFNLKVADQNVRFDFKDKCANPDEVRKALVELAEIARENL